MKVLYIDMQNIHKGTIKNGRKIDRVEFFRYQKKRYGLDKLVMCMGYLKIYQSLYDYLTSIGYEMLFKEVLRLKSGDIKGNVDIDIAIQSVDDFYVDGISGFFLATGDGDYNSLIKYFQGKGIFQKVFIPGLSDTSPLLNKIAGSSAINLENLKHILEKKETATR